MHIDTYLLFSGHNDRAVIALCRFFNQYNLPFVIIAGSSEDPIFKTSWENHVIFCRLDKRLDLNLFQQILNASENLNKRRLIYCPTTEFMNQYILNYREDIEKIGIHISLPSKDIYLKISGKSSSQHIINSIAGLKLPLNIDWSVLKAPCVFKPRKNIHKGAVHYPILCFTEDEVRKMATDLDQQLWFAQTYVRGQSYYLCGYLCRDGRRSYFWQTNLLQQPGGKSIVLAKTGGHPSIDENSLFDELAYIGYFGPFMMEVIQDDLGGIYFIEVNPRFWGTLQLTVDARPEILALFAEDTGHHVDKVSHQESKIFWYSWAKGGRSPNCKKYPEFTKTITDNINYLLDIYDVYARDDTRKLHGLY